MTLSKLTFFFLLVTTLSRSILAETGRVEFDRGGKKKDRDYRPASLCTATPCIITQWGAIRIPHEMAVSHRVEMGTLHRGSYRPVAVFQESTTFEQKFSERVFTRKPNRKIVDLERLVETGKTDTLYMYGLLLQYEFDEADLLVLKLTSLNKPAEVEEYFFRYHNDGAKWDIDFAFVQPFNIFHPNPGDVIQAAYSTASLSFSVARAMDPEKKYRFISKVARSVRVNLFTGILLRKDVVSRGGDNITEDFIDGFAGLGFTFFDFLAAGYGMNMIREPRTTFPFFGLEIRHLMEFLSSMKKDTHTRWQKYLKEEMAKPSVQESSDSLTRSGAP